MACLEKSGTNEPGAVPQLDQAEAVEISDTGFMAAERFQAAAAALALEAPEPSGFQLDDVIDRVVRFANSQPILTGIIVVIVAKKLL